MVWLTSTATFFAHNAIQTHRPGTTLFSAGSGATPVLVLSVTVKACGSHPLASLCGGPRKLPLQLFQLPHSLCMIPSHPSSAPRSLLTSSGSNAARVQRGDSEESHASCLWSSLSPGWAGRTPVRCPWPGLASQPIPFLPPTSSNLWGWGLRGRS